MKYFPKNPLNNLDQWPPGLRSFLKNLAPLPPTYLIYAP